MEYKNRVIVYLSKSETLMRLIAREDSSGGEGEEEGGGGTRLNVRTRDIHYKSSRQNDEFWKKYREKLVVIVPASKKYKNIRSLFRAGAALAASPRVTRHIQRNVSAEMRYVQFQRLTGINLNLFPKREEGKEEKEGYETKKTTKNRFAFGETERSIFREYRFRDYDCPSERAREMRFVEQERDNGINSPP